jgi:cell wall-associated NlpC family hydrolase
VAQRHLTIPQVQRRLTVLNRQADMATEAFNTARVEMHQAMARMTGLQADLDRQRTVVADLRSKIVGTALSDYQSTGGLSTSASFLLAKQPSEFINALATTAVVERQQAGLLTELTQQQNQLGVQEQQAARELRAITADKKELASRTATVEAQIKAAKTLLGNLKEKARLRVLALQRAAAQSTVTPTTRGDVRPPSGTSPAPPYQNAPTPPASGRAAIAVQTALAQIGKPYVYGAAGPSSFDCSGLTMYSWAAAGVSLSHASSVQSGQGVPVSISALQPGDLVFYYSPVSHVAMYIGNGQVVHAPHPGSSVEIVPLYSMPISWARRVG